MTRLPRTALFALLLAAGATAHAAGINDTGIGYCGDDTTNTANCATVGADGGTHPRQDARYGRDAAAAAGQLTKTGGGGKGFDFTKIANDGSVLAASAALGTAATDWACTRDNITGLIWEVKTASGLRGQSYTYTWYNSSPASNGGNVGTASGGTCATTGRCDTEKFVADVNAAGLCGTSDWRMPAVKELEGIADFGRTNPVIDPTYFPNTLGSNYWTVSPFVADSNYAWSVNFNQGHANYFTRNSGYAIRLVRGAVAPTASAVSISGIAQVGQTLTGNYTYADANNDPQGTTTFRWLRSGTAITGATSSTYTLVTADQGNTITFEVTPVATVAPTTGTPVVSTATATVTAPAAPTASAVSISGTAQVGQTLIGSYTYADANNDPQGTSTFRWLRNGVAITGATASTYTLVSADQGNTIALEVTPVATVAPTTGTPVVSGATTPVTVGGYVSQGGLTWMPVTFWNNWPAANTYCTSTTINGQTGWRLPTQPELSALYASGAMNGQGWSLDYTWSSTPFSASSYYYVRLSSGAVGMYSSVINFGVTCVR